MEQEQVEREEEDEQGGKELKTFENEVRFRVTKQRNGRKEREGELVKQIDELAFSLTLELAKGKKQREEMEEKYAQ